MAKNFLRLRWYQEEALASSFFSIDKFVCIHLYTYLIFLLFPVYWPVSYIGSKNEKILYWSIIMIDELTIVFSFLPHCIHADSSSSSFPPPSQSLFAGSKSAPLRSLYIALYMIIIVSHPFLGIHYGPGGFALSQSISPSIGLIE